MAQKGIKMREDLIKIYSSLVTISVFGKDNCAKIVGICNELEKLIAEAEIKNLDNNGGDK